MVGIGGGSWPPKPLLDYARRPMTRTGRLTKLKLAKLIGRLPNMRMYINNHMCLSHRGRRMSGQQNVHLP
jgi:hypothetical protein